MGSPLSGVLNTGVVQKFCDFRPQNHHMSQTIQDSAIVTMECEEETIPKLPNGTSLNDLE